MMSGHRFEVLVVGAGPVGMTAALGLARQGIQVGVIDRESGPSRRSYACALHPSSLAVLEQTGVAELVMEGGHRIQSVSFYEQGLRQGGVDFSVVDGPHPFVLVLPQNLFEARLAEALAAEPNARLLWNHRLTDLEPGPIAVVATVDRLAKSAKGYAVPDVDWETESTLTVEAKYVLGADGYASHVRRCLAIDYERLGEPERYSVFEVETDGPTGTEMKVVLDEGRASVMWPFGGHRCRWGFRLDHANSVPDEREKEREGLDFVETPGEDDSLHHLRKLLEERAPWFDLGIHRVDWSTEIQFERRLARQFGRDRVWLAGDAAHQVGPVGMKSMNHGLAEAADLSARLLGALRGRVEAGPLEAYDAVHRSAWRRLLGLEGETVVTGGALPWVARHAADLPGLIPASGRELSDLLSQIGLNQK